MQAPTQTTISTSMTQGQLIERITYSIVKEISSAVTSTSTSTSTSTTHE